jgi:hypothetical protein
MVRHTQTLAVAGQPEGVGSDAIAMGKGSEWTTREDE